MNKRIDLKNKNGFSSSYLFESINLLEISTVERFTEGMQWVLDNNINAVLIGGTALVTYLSKGRELTPDVDYLVPNVERLKDLLENEGIRYSALVDGNGRKIGITVDIFDTDFIDASVGNKQLNKLILSEYTSFNIGGVVTKVISPELLFILKMELSREKDIKDALLLASAGVMDVNKYSSYLEKLKPTLQDYESLELYKDIIK